jgi:chromosome segregation ATPase
MASVNMNAIYTVLRKVEKSLTSFPTKCESLNTLSLKSKINYLNKDSAKLRKELTRAEKRLKDKDAFISKLMRENVSLKAKAAASALENVELKNKVARSNGKFLELKLSHVNSLKSKDNNFAAYKVKMEERTKKCVNHYEEKLAQKDNYIEKLKAKRGIDTSDSVARPPPTESDYESEEYELPAQTCAVYPQPGWPQCKNGKCGHRRVPEKARRKSNRLKKKGAKGPNISFGDSFKNCNIANIAQAQICVDNSKKKLHITPEFQQAYNAQLARFAAESRGEDPNLVTRKEVGRVTWPMADVD